MKRSKYGRRRRMRIVCTMLHYDVMTLAICLSQYLKMRFGRGMQLFGSIQFLLATVRTASLFCPSLKRPSIQMSERDFLWFSVQCEYLQWLTFIIFQEFASDLLVFAFSQLLYTGIVIYAPALILNQGRQKQITVLRLELIKGFFFHSCAIFVDLWFFFYIYLIKHLLYIQEPTFTEMLQKC